MSLRTHWYAVVPSATALAFGAGCSIVNRIDACDPRGDAEFTVNQVTVDDQYISGPRAAVALPDGNVAVVWNSDRFVTGSNGVPRNPGAVRVGLRAADGRYLSASGLRNGDFDVAAPAAQSTWNPVIAAGSVRGGTVYVAWSQSPLDGASRVFVRPLTATLSPISSDAPASFEISDPDDASVAGRTNATRPSVAVSADGTRALVVYLVYRGIAGGTVRCRPLTVSAATDVHGQLAPNPVDGADAAGSLSAEGPVGFPVIARFGDGFVVVWPDFSQGRWQATWRFMNHLGMPREALATELGGLRDRNALPLLALERDGDELLLAWSRTRSAAPLLRDVVYRRFARDLRPLGAEVVANAEAGDHNSPAVVPLPRGGVMVSWDDDTRGTSATRVLARAFDRDGRPLFTREACERGEFSLPGAAPGRQTISALVRVGDDVFAVWRDASERAPDAFGLSVRGRSFGVTELAPALQ